MWYLLEALLFLSLLFLLTPLSQCLWQRLKAAFRRNVDLVNLTVRATKEPTDFMLRQWFKQPGGIPESARCFYANFFQQLNYYCYKCRVQIIQSDLEVGTAKVQGSKRNCEKLVRKLQRCALAIAEPAPQKENWIAQHRKRHQRSGIA